MNIEYLITAYKNLQISKQLNRELRTQVLN